MTASSSRPTLPQLDDLQLGLGDWQPSEDSLVNLRARLAREEVCSSEHLESVVEVICLSAERYVFELGARATSESRAAVQSWLAATHASLQTLDKALKEFPALEARVDWIDRENDERPPLRAREKLREIDMRFFPSSSALLGLPEDRLLDHFMGHDADGDSSWPEVVKAHAVLADWVKPRLETLELALSGLGRGSSDKRSASHGLARVGKTDWKWLKSTLGVKGSLEKFASIVVDLLADNGYEVDESALVKLLKRG